MHKLGMIGGMAWESTIDYYRLINKQVQDKLGGWVSPELILYSVNFQEILKLQNANQWGMIADILINISIKLQKAGAEGIMLCSNTIHKVAEQIQSSIRIPIINTIDATCRAIKKANYTKVALMGTKFTMESQFYRKRLREKFNIEAIIPTKQQRKIINNSIYNEFAKGIFNDEKKEIFLDIMTDLQEKGAQGIILGCTEIPLLIKQSDTDIPLFDTLKNHIDAAVSFIIEE